MTVGHMDSQRHERPRSQQGHQFFGTHCAARVGEQGIGMVKGPAPWSSRTIGAGPAGSLDPISSRLRRFRRVVLGLVGGVEKGGQGDVGLAVGVVESLEDIGGLGCTAGQEPLGAQDQPRIAVVGVDLEVRLEARQAAAEFGRLAVNGLDVRCGDDPAGLRGLRVAQPVGGTV